MRQAGIAPHLLLVAAALAFLLARCSEDSPQASPSPTPTEALRFTPSDAHSAPTDTREAHAPTSGPIDTPTATSVRADDRVGIPTTASLDPCETTSGKDLEELAILFTAEWSGTPDVYMVDAAGRRHVLVAGGPAHQLQPMWFSAGDEVSFLAGHPGALFSLYTVPSGEGLPALFPGTESSIGQLTVEPLSGTSVLVTPDQDTYYLWYAWAPGSSAVAFRGVDGTLNHIYVASEGEKRLDMTPEGVIQTGDLSWSSDGGLLAFEEFTAPMISTIRLLESPGHLATLTEEFARASAPRWSPARRELVFIGDVPFPYTQPSEPRMYLADVPGRSAVPIATSSAPIERAWWSPSGTRIAFTRFELDSDGRFASKGIGVVSPGDDSVRQLVDDIGLDLASISWSPDGRYLSYTTTRPSGTDLYVVSVCTGVTALTVENVLPGPAPWRPSDGLAGTPLANEP
jgi:Tol biopolymer transport system component